MTKAAPQILRDVAALVIRRGLDGRTFPLSVGSTEGTHGRDAPLVVRKAAVHVRWRMAGATAEEVAGYLTGRALAMEGERDIGTGAL